MFLFGTVVSCPPPPVIANASQIGSEIIYNSLIHYTCHDGLRMEDGRTEIIIICNEFSDWSESNMKCQGIIYT